MNAKGKPAPFGAIAAVQNTTLLIQGLSVTWGSFISLAFLKGASDALLGGKCRHYMHLRFSLSIPESESGLIEQGVTCH